jgi:hypothetical protein
VKTSLETQNLNREIGLKIITKNMAVTKDSTSKFGITTILFTLLLIVFLTGCSMSNNITQIEIERFIGADLPQQATDIKFSQQQGLDTLVYLRFNLPPEDLKLFLVTIGFKKTLKDLFPIVPTVSTGGRPEWWLPDHLTNYAAEEDIINGKVYQIAVDKSRTDAWIIYMLVSTI